MRKTKLIAVLMASLVLIYTSCSEKEVTQKVEDTQRVDALRNELFELQRLVFGTDGGAEGLATTNELLGMENAELEEQIALLQAEVDRLTAIYETGVPYQVIVTDFQNQPIAGATVTVNENGTIVDGTTDAEGKVSFEKVRAGAIVGVVSATGFATANYGTSLYFDDGGAIQAGVNTRIALLPKSGTLAESSMFTVTGFLYADLNTANDTLTGFRYGNEFGTMFTGSTEANRLPQGPNVNFLHRSFDKMNKKMWVTIDMDTEYIPYSEYHSDNVGAVQFIAYEGVKWEATFDANNQFTVKLPVATYIGTYIQDFYFRFSAEQFSASKTMVDTNASGVWSDSYNYDYNFGWVAEVPTSAYPAPKTFTQSRIYRMAGYQMNNNFSGQVWNHDVYIDTDYFGTSGLGAVAGSTYTVDLYYFDSRN